MGKKVRKSKKMDDLCFLSTAVFKYYCSYLDKNIEVEIDNKDLHNYLSSSDSECDLCGSHGDITLEVKCECGYYHYFEISSW